jgi:hypothetical protein
MLSSRLERLGDALEAAAAADLAPRPARSRRRLVVVAAALAILIPGAAIAAGVFSTGDVAKSLPAGTLALAGTEPSCTVVHEGVEYRCTLKRAPKPEVSDWKGTVEPTVDATKHVNGGCRSLASDGRTWECYLGREAVRQRIIGAGLLGEYAPAPGQG